MYRTIPVIEYGALNNGLTFRQGDTIWKYVPFCKIYKVSGYSVVRSNGESLNEKSKPFLAVHGNITYDFLSRSYSDTPYYQKDFRQHTVQSSMNVTVNDQLSFRVNLAMRVSNSPYFKNTFIGGFQFDPNAYISKMKQSAIAKVASEIPENIDLQIAETHYGDLLKKYNDIKSDIGGPDITQLLIEERKKKFFNKVAPKRGGDKYRNKVDSLAGKTNKIDDYITGKKKQLDSLQNIISKAKTKADSLKSVIAKKTTLIKQKIYKAKNANELSHIMSDNGIVQEKRNKAEQLFANIKSIGFGRSMINYSELTVSNVSITGLNVEYNPNIYAAFAAGRIDYGFRDFLGRNRSVNRQNLTIGRIGVGDKDRKAIILSVYTGRKYNYGSVLNDTVNSYINVTGYAIETILNKNDNTGINVEVAKSTMPLSGSLNENKGANSLFRFSDQSNQAISIKAKTIIHKTGTRVNGFFRKSGKNFQSFSLFNYNTDQTAWFVKADQSFLKDKIALIAMLRRNDFTNPFAERTFKTSAVFTSLQLNVRFPKWPVISAGYFPGSQLYIIDREHIRENVYYIMNGSILHTYSIGSIRMTSSGIYNHYSNKSTDSGFIKYRGTNYILSHSLFFQKIQLEARYMFTDQRELKFSTTEVNAFFSPVSFFSAGAGGKYNKTNNGKTYWGGQAQVVLDIKKLGRLQFHYEKSYLPTIYQTLFPVEIGRVSWSKYF